MNITGSCLCGAVRFEVVKDAVWAHHCHCSRCRKTRGAAFASNMFVPADGLRFLAGRDELTSYQPPGAERFTHVFCRRCGSTMPWLNESRGTYVIPMGCLDGDPVIRPMAHIFVDSMAPWFAITDDVEQNDGAPGTGRAARST